MSAALYLHIPFCLSRCGYCTFVSGIYDSAVADRYLSCLRDEYRHRCDGFFGGAGTFRPSSIFIGGGTPSCLSMGQLEALFSFLPRVELGGEVTVECNPDSVDREKLLFLRGCGVNRLSFGVQTFSEAGLGLLGRRHDGGCARRVVEMALGMGFLVNIDLIYGWPGEDAGVLREDLRVAVGLGVHHLSCYSLIVDEAAWGYEKYATMLGGDEVGDEIGGRFWDEVDGYLEESGFCHYETSNFCRGGWECRHNVNVWEGGEYLGIGVGAHSSLGGGRFWNSGGMGEYFSGVGGGCERLGFEERAREGGVMWLRMFRGVDLEEFREKFGVGFREVFGSAVEELLGKGWLEYGEGGRRIRVARKYQAVLDSVLVELL